MQACCEITRRLCSAARLPTSFDSVIESPFQSESSQWSTGVKDEFPSTFVCVYVGVCVCLPQPLTICLSGSNLPLLRLNAKLAVTKQPLREERFRWVNSSSYILFYALRMSAYWKQESKSMRGKLQKRKRRNPTTCTRGAGVKRKQCDRRAVKNENWEINWIGKWGIHRKVGEWDEATKDTHLRREWQ